MMEIGKEFCAFDIGPDTPEVRKCVILAMKRAEEQHGMTLGPIIYGYEVLNGKKAFGGTAKVVKVDAEIVE